MLRPCREDLQILTLSNISDLAIRVVIYYRDMLTFYRFTINYV